MFRGPYAAGVTGAGVGAEAGRRMMAGSQREQAALARDRMFYPKSNAGAAMMGAVLPQAIYGLLGPGEGR